MRLGLHLPDFTWPEGSTAIADHLGAIASTADEVGFDRISVMDHLYQIVMVGPAEHEMLEAYTTLGFLAAKTSSAKLLTLCTAVTYREPGLLAKAVTTLDVISGGRAMLGIGVAWNGEEAEGLGLFFPPMSERYERLEETLQICLQMWSDDEGSYNGEYYHLGRTLNAPQSLTRPHPPILIGGSGVKKTLRLVAKYADACNLFYGNDLSEKLDALAEHCERESRPYDDIEKTVLYPIDPGPEGERCAQIVDDLGTLAELGFTVAHGAVNSAHARRSVEILGERVIPEIAAL
jgi:F420-dependent oxidoreductase-like protein